ncbi:MAG TPA: hypothetical protein DHW82_10300 [Spirochaetia bacterium]|nr:MAG: hypothetical protein A2Y41_03865 [Spirochaetes bacterium GWB1_36_13]HCL57382.1 hypothetical protein [Spirochaetia bacterium]
MTEEIVEKITKGVISQLEFNDDVEENFQKIIHLKINDIAMMLKQKDIHMEQATLKENFMSFGEKYLIHTLSNKIKYYLSSLLNSPVWSMFGENVIKNDYQSYFEHNIDILLQKDSIRKLYYNVITLWNSDIIDRYIPAISGRRIYGSAYIFTKPITNSKLLIDFLRVSAFFYPVVADGFTHGGNTHFIEKYFTYREGYDKFFQILGEYMRDKFGNVPEPIYFTGIEASVNKNKLNYETVMNIRGDLLRIFLYLANFKQKQAAANNKKADYPEKSLFNLFQKQCDFLGLNKNLLFDLEFVARENRW